MNIDFSNFLNIYDLSFLTVLIISFLLGIKNGILKSLLNLIKWIIIFYSVKYSFGTLGSVFSEYITNKMISDILVFLLVFLISYIFLSLINRLLISFLQSNKSGFIDIIFGGIFGIVRGYIIFIILIVFIYNSFSFNSLPVLFSGGVFEELLNYGIDLISTSNNFNL